MSKLGKRLIQAAREGVAIARGELDPSTYRVHRFDDDAAVPLETVRGRVKVHHDRKAGRRVAYKKAKRG